MGERQTARGEKEGKRGRERERKRKKERGGREGVTEGDGHTHRGETKRVRVRDGHNGNLII